jgi:DNA mismatch repair protein MutL
VDVNVHPAKTEVRFRQASWLHDFVRDTIRHKLTLGRPAAGFLRALTVHPSSTPELGPEFLNPGFLNGARGREDTPTSDGWLTGNWQGNGSSPVGSPEEDSEPAGDGFTLSPRPLEAAPGVLPFAPFATPPAGERAQNGHSHGCATAIEELASAEAGSEEGSEAGAGPTLRGLASLRPLGQLRDSFILAVNQEGLWIIDQHVAHERILFERVLRQRQVEKVERQRLLMPMLIDLLPAQMVTFAAIARELDANGFEVEPFGPRTIAIKAAPVGLEGSALERMLVEVLEQAGSPEQAENLEAARTRIAASIACHAAIKVNTPLDGPRMEWLLAELAQTEHPTSCPHGRPIVLRYAWKEIQRAFHRI